ncbi:MAG: ATP-binding protein [Actinobacteria bacterium]|nr:MAG: ATP-binding protein [Actinomycetota bacterium]
MTKKNLTNELTKNLVYLKLPWIRENYEELATDAAAKEWGHVNFLGHLIEGEANLRLDRATERRIKAAHFPVVKTIEEFDWTWPKKINRAQIQNLLRLNFIEQKANVVFLGGVGLGKTHLAITLGYQACLQGHRTLFTSAADIINTLTAAQAAHRLKLELKKYLRPALLVIDELGFMPIDKHGADMLFQVISQRYEQGAIILTTNKNFKTWASIFNNDSVVTSAILDRLLHHAETAVILGKSYRLKDRIEPA